MTRGRRALLIGGAALAAAVVAMRPRAGIVRWLAGEPPYEQEINDAAELLKDEGLLLELETFADSVLARDHERALSVAVPPELQALCGEDSKRTNVRVRSSPPRVVLHCVNHRYAAVVYAAPSTHEADEHTRRVSPRTVIIGT